MRTVTHLDGLAGWGGVGRSGLDRGHRTGHDREPRVRPGPHWSGVCQVRNLRKQDTTKQGHMVRDDRIGETGQDELERSVTGMCAIRLRARNVRYEKG